MTQALQVRHDPFPTVERLPNDGYTPPLPHPCRRNRQDRLTPTTLRTVGRLTPTGLEPRGMACSSGERTSNFVLALCRVPEFLANVCLLSDIDPLVGSVLAHYMLRTRWRPSACQVTSAAAVSRPEVPA